jgi:uncharacterized protein involved in type VI secretion and phage assembly
MKLSQNRTYYGKYRGTVVNNVDPLQRGRLLVSVPDVLGGAPSSWAEPCVPLAGNGVSMGVYLVPPVGAGVWVEFEQGDCEFPIWVGCRWGTTSDLPAPALAGLTASPSIVLQSQGQHAIVISDQPGALGGITLKSAAGVALVVNDTGIFLQNSNGTILISGKTVDVNNGALTVV